MEHAQLTEKIIGCAMQVHRILGPGFLESVYQKAFAHELRKSGLLVECDYRLQVHYDGVLVGEFVPDMLVSKAVLVENKAVRTLTPTHEVQLVNYLTATGVEVGLLINFGAVQLEFKRKARTFRPKSAQRATRHEMG
jgi:GxxExxY protein